MDGRFHRSYPWNAFHCNVRTALPWVIQASLRHGIKGEKGTSCTLEATYEFQAINHAPHCGFALDAADSAGQCEMPQ
jgi:hypothetical protein